MNRPKPPRRPKDLDLKDTSKTGEDSFWVANGYLFINHLRYGLKSAKRLHSWLTKAIIYLEQEGK